MISRIAMGMNKSVRTQAGIIACLVGGLTPSPARVVDELSPLVTLVHGFASVPAELLDHSFFVMVTINGAGPFRMLVDTGCTVTVLSPSLAAAIGLPSRTEPSRRQTAVNGLGDRLAIRAVELDTLEIGEAHFESVPAAVTDDFEFPSKIVGTRVDGALGFSLFEQTIIALDYAERRFVIGPRPASNLPPLRAELPLRLGEDIPWINVGLQGKTILLEVDTGSNRGLQISPELAQDLAWEQKPRASGLVSVLGETAREYAGRLSGELTMRDVTQTAPVAVVTRGAPSLGTTFLENFYVEFDQPRTTIRLYSANEGGIPSPSERSLGLSMLAEAAGWRVVAIVPESPAADLGIEAGDLLTEFEGEPSSSWTRDRLNAWRDTHDTLKTRIEHAGNSREVTLPVWTLVR